MRTKKKTNLEVEIDVFLEIDKEALWNNSSADYS